MNKIEWQSHPLSMSNFLPIFLSDPENEKINKLHCSACSARPIHKISLSLCITPTHENHQKIDFQNSNLKPVIFVRKYFWNRTQKPAFSKFVKSLFWNLICFKRQLPRSWLTKKGCSTPPPFCTDCHNQYSFFLLLLVSHLWLSKISDDSVEGWLNHFIVLTLYQKTPKGFKTLINI